MTPLGLIPAKGYSERLPKKNLRLLGGKPLLAWAIESAQASGLFGDNLWVSSESDEILALATDMGCRTLRRPSELAMPEATISHVLLHARHQLEWHGAMYVLQPASPFRSAFGIREAWDRFRKIPTAAAMFSLRPSDPPEWTLRWDAIGGAVVPQFPKRVDAPRSSLQGAWRHDGSHFILGPMTSEGGAFGFEADPIEAVDINTHADLEYAEYLLATGKVPWIAPK